MASNDPRMVFGNLRRVAKMVAMDVLLHHLS